MELTELITESLAYPSRHIKSLLVYMVLCIVIGLVLVATGLGTAFTANFNVLAGGALGIFGIILSIILFVLVAGYLLDVVKYGISRSDEEPEIDVVRQASNGVKSLITKLVYYIIPAIVLIVLSVFLQQWLALLIFFVLCIIFGLAETMAQCRLAQTEELADALDIPEAINDISRIGVVKVLMTLIVIALVSTIIYLIVTVGLSALLGESVTAIVAAILSIYLLFFENRAIGLLYSDI